MRLAISRNSSGSSAPVGLCKLLRYQSERRLNTVRRAIVTTLMIVGLGGLLMTLALKGLGVIWQLSGGEYFAPHASDSHAVSECSCRCVLSGVLLLVDLVQVCVTTSLLRKALYIAECGLCVL